MTWMLIAGKWCIFCMQCESSTDNHVALLSFWEALAACRLSSSFVFSAAVSNCLLCPFQTGVPISTHSLLEFTSSPLHLSTILLQQCRVQSPYTQLSTYAWGRPYDPVWQRNECSWVKPRTCIEPKGALCVYLCHGRWLGSSYRNKRLPRLGISQRSNVLVLYFAV